MKAPLIHIGYNKTGSTWLQEALFPRRDLGFLSFLEIEDREAIYRTIVRQQALTFDGSSVLEYYRQKTELLENQDLLPVLSNERLSGDPHSGGYDCKELADRLSQLFPDAHILIVIREQRSMLDSTYKQYIRAGGPRKLPNYFHPPERGSRRMPAFSFAYFEYHHLINYYQRLFGKEKVLILPYEWMRTDPQGFVQEIMKFAGLPVSEQQLEGLPFSRQVNRGYGLLTLAIKRHYNRFFLENSLNPGAILGLPYSVERRLVRILEKLDRMLPKAWQQQAAKARQRTIDLAVGDRYQNSNRQVQALSGLDLESVGYDL